MILVGKQALFAKLDAIEEAALALKRVGAVVILKPVSRSLEFASGTFYRVGLAVNLDAIRGPLWSRLSNKQSPGSYRSFADCFRTSATVSGFNPGGKVEKEELQLATGNIPVITKTEARERGAGDLPAARAAASFFEHAFPTFLEKARADKDIGDGLTEEIWSELRRYKKMPIGVPKTQAAPIIYKKILAHSAAKRLFSKTFGINEALAPRLGTAITQVNDQAEKEQSEQDKWNFHWAGVIMRDGSDYVTLENCAVELDEATAEEIRLNSDAFQPNRTVTNQKYSKQDLINERWYFKMHGVGSQSFHSENLEDPHATPSVITLPFAKVM